MSLDKVLQHIEDKLNISDKTSICTLFAYNTTGKTRLSKLFEEKHNINSIKVLCYNSFFEDFFYWDNEKYLLKIKFSWLTDLIIKEGLDGEIIKYFKKLINSKLEPSFIQNDKKDINVSFSYFTGDDNNCDNIKISRAKESLFIWSIFCVILEMILNLDTNKENRSTHLFDDIEYIIIDDPVSSMDDTKIITLTLDLIDLIKKTIGNTIKLNLLITTHHCLFFNILYNNFRTTKEIKNIFYILSKDSNNELELKEQKNSPFSYHNLIIKEIQEAIDKSNLKKYHFNLFRTILEKTSNFLGYEGGWSKLLDKNDDNAFISLLNEYSHNNISESEAGYLSNIDIELFKKNFRNFIQQYKWNQQI